MTSAFVAVFLCICAFGSFWFSCMLRGIYVELVHRLMRSIFVLPLLYRMTRSIEWSTLQLGLSLSALSRPTACVTPRDELQSKAAEVATIAEEAKSSLGSQTEPPHDRVRG